MIRMTLAIAAISASPALGQDLESMQRASELGSVLASEKLCELSLNQTGIEAWVAKNVAEDDLGFAQNLMIMTQGAEYQMGSLSGAGKTAHCAAVRKTAKAMGLID